MDKINELKTLLERLKGEVTAPAPDMPYDPPAQRWVEPEPRRRPEPQPAAIPPRPERLSVPARPEFPRPDRGQAPAGANILWSENKETMLFGMLASLVMVLGGILAALEWLILIGAVVSMLFSFITFLALFGCYLNFRGKHFSDANQSARMDQRPTRAEKLPMRAGPPDGLRRREIRDSEQG